jgi:sarcosine oxidase, subunit beta
MSKTEVAEVVIVGGGVVGCSLAYELSARGVDTVVLDRGSLGAESTGKNAGGVRQQFSTEINVRIQMLSVRILDEFEETIGVSPGFRKLGYLFVLRQPEDAARFAELVEMWHGLGLTEARWVTPDDIAELAPAVALDGVLGGTFCPSDGVASPADVTYGYATAARRLGARFHEGREVTAIALAQRRITGVSTPVGDIGCRVVFICAGAWAAQIAGLAEVDLPVTPYRRHVFVTGEVAGVTPDSPFTVDAASTFYFHPEAIGALMGMSDPAEPPSFDTRTDWEFLHRISEVAATRAPAFLDAEIRTGWAGLYEVTPDNQPIVGPVSELDGLWAACGFSGHGFMQAPAIARLLAERYAEGEASVDLTPFGFDRFATGALVPELNVI